MTTLQKTLIAGTMAVVVGVGIYETRRTATLRHQVQTLRQEHASLSEEIRRLKRERNDTTNRPTWLSFTNAAVPATENVTGILTDPNFRVVIKALQQRTGSETLAEPEVITSSGRQAQLRVVNVTENMILVFTNPTQSFTNQHRAE